MKAQVLHYANELATCTRQTYFSKPFANSLNMQKQYEKMFGKRVIDDVYHVVACTGVFEIDGEMSPRCVDRR